MEEPWSLSYVHPELIHKALPNGALVDDGSHNWQSPTSYGRMRSFSVDW
jgi:hypothetical protein